MPLLPQNYALPPASLHLWLIDEEESVLQASLQMFPMPELKHAQRRRQWMASRLCLLQLLQQQGLQPEVPLPGKAPVLLHSTHAISISHTNQWAAAMISPAKSCGLDLEKIGAKVPAIKNKFMRTDEQVNPIEINQLLWQHLVWSAKETIFKMHQVGNLDFREHIKIEALGNHLLAATLLKPGYEAVYQVSYQLIQNQDFVLTYTDSEQLR